MVMKFTLTVIASANSLAISGSKPKISPSLDVMFKGGMSPMVATTNSPLCWMRSITGDAEVPPVDCCIWAHPAINIKASIVVSKTFANFIFNLLFSFA
jgi:hypothetical protein